MIAWVPHSASAITRTCGKAACSPRCVLGRPNATALAGVSATSTGAAPRLPSPPPGSPPRPRALPGSPPAPRPGQPLGQQPGDLLVADLAEQAHGQHVV